MSRSSDLGTPGQPTESLGALRSWLLSVCRQRRLPLGLRRRIARFAVPYSEQEYEIEIDGIAYRGRLDNYIEWVAYVTGQFYEFSYLNLIRGLALGGSALDVGANVGNHTAALSRMFDEVLAFEPYPALYERLRAKVGERPGVEVFPVGLGRVDGEMRFNPPEGRNLGKGSVDARGRERVRIVHGDSFLEGRVSGDIRFVKVDVEGSEVDVLQGLSGTIARQRPVVMYEVSHRRGRASRESFAVFPEGYEFWSLRGQSTFPLQRQAARAVPLRGGKLTRRCRYVIACPVERDLVLSRRQSPGTMVLFAEAAFRCPPHLRAEAVTLVWVGSVSGSRGPTRPTFPGSRPKRCWPGWT